MNRSKRNWCCAAVVVALLLLTAPAVVLACIPQGVNGMMAAGTLNVLDELPGGG